MNLQQLSACPIFLFGPPRSNGTYDIAAIATTKEKYKPYRGPLGEWTLILYSPSVVSWFACALAGSEQEFGKKFGQAHAMEQLTGTTIRCPPKTERENCWLSVECKPWLAEVVEYLKAAASYATAYWIAHRRVGANEAVEAARLYASQYDTRKRENVISLTQRDLDDFDRQSGGGIPCPAPTHCCW